jgi:ubiquinone/menaquinone biosynthesis C-methylase UbiE
MKRFYLLAKKYWIFALVGFIDEFHLLNGDQLPLEDNSVDLCIAYCILEHLENPKSFFSESRRVIKDKGYLWIRTPNVLIIRDKLRLHQMFQQVLLLKIMFGNPINILTCHE